MSESLKKILTGIGIVLLLIGGLILNPFSWNDAGERQVIQTIGGELFVRFEPGIYFSGVFATVTTYPNNVTIQVGDDEKRSDEVNFFESVFSSAIGDNGEHVLTNVKVQNGTFAGGDQATITHTVKWDLPNTTDDMIQLHTTYTSIDNLMSTTLIQYQKETASYSCQRMESEAHYSGGQSQLKEYFQDQLRNGQVLLNTQTKTRITKDGNSEKYVEVEEKRNSKGDFLRTISDIQKYNLYASFVSVDNVDYDERIDKKLKDKIDAASDESTSKQRLITAQQEEQEAIVKGRKLIAEVTAKEEASEQEEVIQARKAKFVAKEKLEEDRYKAESTVALKKAEAEGDRLKVQAGLSPLERATIDKDTQIGVARELASIKFPQSMVIVGGGSSGSSNGVNPFDAIGLESFYNLSERMSKVK